MLGAPKSKAPSVTDESDEWTDAGQDLLDAFGSKDASAIGLVLKRMCSGDSYEDDAADEE